MSSRAHIDSLEVGDDLTFKAACRSGCRKATRKVSGFRRDDLGVIFAVNVKSYQGWTDFAVLRREVIEP